MNRIALLIGICAFVGLAGCTPSKEASDEIGKFEVTSPIVTDTSFTREYVTQIQSLQNIELRAMTKGFIQTINVDEGQLVKSGQVLFTIMPKEYEAELQKAKAEAKTAELEWLNTKTLEEKSIVSQTELAIAQSKLDQAKAQVALAELYLSFTIVKAPFDGVIDRIRFKIGSLIDEGTLLTTLSNNKEVYAYFNVSESEYLEYKTKNDGEAKVGLLLANNQMHKYKGTIETIEGEFDNSTGNIAFRAKFPNPDLLLKHGETGKILMTIPIKNALIIPQKATFEIQGKVYVYKVDENNVVKSQNISIKQSLPNIYIVESGLSEKDKILLEGVQSVKDDDKILANYVSLRSVIGKLQLIPTP
ncbi:MAG: efflux RND transporter periplasmic adaptor subunit [Cyclobacteriaceae bacterium]|nr:efflux RND transporter periplasmic adaptor subunit [Cyclobacteriaceae bacterium]